MRNLMQKSIPFQIKAASGNEIEGHGSVFGNIDLGGDVVQAGAFTKSLRKHKSEGTMPAMLWQHDHERPIGVWHEMKEDDTGLYMRGEFARTQDGRDAAELVRMKALRGLSIGFSLKDFEFDEDGIRFIKEADLWETSVVTFPMNPSAVIEAVKHDPRSFETHLREAGCSRREARDIVHDAVKNQCEADDEEIAKRISELNDLLIVEKMRQFRERNYE
jgi:HK97 family phage prohead protease